jgi:hypothetical protein
MVLPRRQPLDDESEPLQPVFHAMDPAAAGPRYGKHTDRPPPARSATPIYERQTPRQNVK